MACLTCDYTMRNTGPQTTFWCPQCGSIKTGDVFDSPTNQHVRDAVLAPLREKMATFMTVVDALIPAAEGQILCALCGHLGHHDVECVVPVIITAALDLKLSIEETP